MKKSGSIFDNLVGNSRRVFVGLLGLAPLAIPLLTAGCSTSVSASANANTCTASSVSCANGGTSYTCTSGSPSVTSDTVCTATDSTGDFCCYTYTTSVSGSCVTTASAICQSGNGTSYSCTGTAQPEQGDPSLICNTNGAGDYCCIASTTSCVYDAAVVGCGSGSYGYSCAVGDQPPDMTDPTLVCSEPTAAGTLDEYCCYTDTTTATGTCTEDPTVGCQPDSAGHPAYGFSCTGPESPETDYSNITCSDGTAGTTDTLYCCTYQ